MRGTGEAGGRLKSLGGAVTSIGGTLTKSVTLPVAGAGAACVKLASDFETSMAKINTIAGASKQELAEMRKEILATSSEMGMAAKDFAQATYDSISSGIDKADAVNFTKDSAKLAKAGFTNVTVATDVLTSTINAYGKSAKDATEISNQLIVAQNLGKVTVDEMGASLGNVIPIASALGVKTEELFSSIAVTTAQGIKPAQSITGLKAAMSNIVKPSEQAKKAAEALGLQFDANAVKTKGWMGFLEDVKSKLESSAPAYAKKLEEVNKLRKAVESAGNGSKKYKEEIEKEREKISKLRDEKKNLTSKDKERKKAIDVEVKSIQEHIKTLQKQSKAEKDGAGNVKEMKKQLKEKEKELKILEGTSKGTLTAFSTMFGSVEGLNTVMSMTSNSGAELYNKSMKEMKENTTATKEAFDKMMDTPEEKFNKAKVQLQNLGITIGGHLLPHVVRFLDAFSKVLETIEKLPGPVKKTIVSFIGMAAIAGPIMTLSGNVIKLGGTIFGTLGKLKSVPKIISGIAGGSAKAIGGLGKAFKGLGKAASLGIKGTLTIVKGLGKGIGTVFGGIGKGILGIVKIFTKLPALLSPHVLLIVGLIAGIGFIVYEVIKHWDTIKEVAGKIWGGIKKAIEIPVKGAVKFLKFAFVGLPKTFFNFGVDIIGGLVKGLWSMVEKVGEIIGKIAGKITGGFKKLLGINSPSKVFDGYGVNIGEGLVQGVDKQEGVISSKFKGLANKIKGLGKVRPEFQGLNNLALSGAYGSNHGISNITNANSSNKQFKFEPKITMHVTVSDTGEKGTKQLTSELKNMTENSMKNVMTELFMNDVLRD
ncbi:phage tail tape measure protein [Hathewaya massiliensis]|uniref:phage tail tape measure protein n=1 Tax=Hathewaya massiliensis TaxID=1964382 RepID=UPI00115B83A2|nr:phage tail tape measure protein [Hathewaya massiliensis]